MTEVINQQSEISVPIKIIEKWTKHALSSFVHSKNKHASVVFINNKEIAKLNLQFRNKNSTTDVLSFPNVSEKYDSDTYYLGDIVISAQQAYKQARENNLTIEQEIKQLILHGILHLCGYDHENDSGEMNELELKLRDELGINY